MPREKTDMKRIKAPQQKSKEKLTNFAKRQSLNKEVEVLDGVDSLVVLKDVKERKKHSDVDERIMLLKTELKSIFGGTDEKNDLQNPQKVEKPKDMECSVIPENSNSPTKPTISKIKEFKPGFCSTPFKFTAQLGNTVDETNSPCQTGKSNKVESILLTSELETEVPTSNRFSNNKVEEMLYKSFILKNFGLHLSDLHDTGSENNLKEKTDQKKCSTSKKPSKGKPVQRKSQHCRDFKRGRKKRIVTLNSPERIVEVIDLESTKDNEIPGAEQSYIDLDVSSYDWGEPFDVDDDDVVTINNSKVDDKVGSKISESISTEEKENENAEDKQQEKKVWECPVCFEQSKGQEIVATQCGHVFCKNCIKNHTSKIKNNCPTCRANLKNKPLITLFNF